MRQPSTHDPAPGRRRRGDHPPGMSLAIPQTVETSEDD